MKNQARIVAGLLVLALVVAGLDYVKYTPNEAETVTDIEGGSGAHRESGGPLKELPPIELAVQLPTTTQVKKVRVIPPKIDREYAWRMAVKLGVKDKQGRSIQKKEIVEVEYKDGRKKPLIPHRSPKGYFPSFITRREGGVEIYTIHSNDHPKHYLLNDTEAAKAAERWLRDKELFPEGAYFFDSSCDNITVIDKKTGEVIQRYAPPVCYYRFDRKIDGIRLVSTDGATISLGDHGEVMSVWIDWFDLKVEGDMPIKSAAQALEDARELEQAFYDSNPITEVNLGVLDYQPFSTKIVIDKIELQYKLFNSISNELIPYWVFTGKSYCDHPDGFIVWKKQLPCNNTELGGAWITVRADSDFSELKKAARAKKGSFVVS